MDVALVQLLFFGIAAALANILGGLIVFPIGSVKNYKKLLKYILALGAGFMLSVTFVEILPEVAALWQEAGSEFPDAFVIPMVLLLAGYMLTQFFEHTIAPHFHLGEEFHHEGESMIKPSSAYTAIGGLLIHALFDGVSIAAAMYVDATVGFLVFIAIFLHKFPEGFTIGSMILAAGKEKKQVVAANLVVGLTTLAGVVAFYFIGSNMGFTVAYALPLASGVTLYVAASDLIPEVNHHGGKNPLVSFSVFAGVAVFFLLHFLLDSVFHG